MPATGWRCSARAGWRLILERADLSEEAIVAASLGLAGQPARLAS